MNALREGEGHPFGCAQDRLLPPRFFPLPTAQDSRGASATAGGEAEWQKSRLCGTAEHLVEGVRGTDPPAVPLAVTGDDFSAVPQALMSAEMR